MASSDYRIPSLSDGRAWRMSREARLAMQALGCLVLAAAAQGRTLLASCAREELARLGRSAARERKSEDL